MYTTLDASYARGAVPLFGQNVSTEVQYLFLAKMVRQRFSTSSWPKWFDRGAVVPLFDQNGWTDVQYLFLTKT